MNLQLYVEGKNTLLKILIKTIYYKYVITSSVELEKLSLIKMHTLLTANFGYLNFTCLLE